MRGKPRFGAAEDHEIGSKDRANTCGSLSDVQRYTSRPRCRIVHKQFPNNLQEENLKFKRLFSALPLTPEHRQLRLQW
ncbi:hypothetical protein TNCV_1205921 [Trichonephila clavipes]|nr:hypothetical protein TNCV_1205921 [Trichonephila clavipes]